MSPPTLDPIQTSFQTPEDENVITSPNPNSRPTDPASKQELHHHLHHHHKRSPPEQDQDDLASASVPNPNAREGDQGWKQAFTFDTSGHHATLQRTQDRETPQSDESGHPIRHAIEELEEKVEEEFEGHHHHHHQHHHPHHLHDKRGEFPTSLPPETESITADDNNGAPQPIETAENTLEFPIPVPPNLIQTESAPNVRTVTISPLPSRQPTALSVPVIEGGEGEVSEAFVEANAPQVGARPRKNRTLSAFELAHRSVNARRVSVGGMSMTPSTSSDSSSVGSGSYILKEKEPLSWRHLFKRPIVRQWLYQENLYYEPTNRGISKFELFFDLAFVGVIHQLAESASEPATGLNVLKFILCFYPAWSVWSDARNFINISGTDDMIQRTFIMAIMILLIGYSVNASGIEFNTTEGEGSASKALIALTSNLLLRREGEDPTTGGGESTGGGEIGENVPNANALSPESHFNIAATAGFYLTAKAIRFGLYIIYGLKLPNFRYTHFLNAYSILIVSSLYLPLVTHTLPTRYVVGLVSTAIILEILSRYFLGIFMESFRAWWVGEWHLMSWVHHEMGLPSTVGAGLTSSNGTPLMSRMPSQAGRGERDLEMGHKRTSNGTESETRVGEEIEMLKEEGKKVEKKAKKVFNDTRKKSVGYFEFYPALNLGHFTERMAAFVVLVLGETIINVTFKADGKNIGPHQEFGKSAFGLIIAFMLAWLYFDSDSSRVFLHALRRNIFTSISFGHLHFPFCASLILISAAMAQMVQDTRAPDGIRWYFGGGIAAALVSISLMGFLHFDLDKKGSSLMGRNFRLTLRLLVAVFFATFPLADHISDIVVLAISAAVLTCLVAVEQVGKIGSVGDLKKLYYYHQGKHTEGVNLDEFEMEEGAEEEFVGLTEAEKGEDDVGVEGDVGEIEMKKITKTQWMAYAAW